MSSVIPAPLKEENLNWYVQLGETSTDPTLLGAAVIRLCAALLHEYGVNQPASDEPCALVPFEIPQERPAARPGAG
jgi:hypothetical protein